MHLRATHSDPFVQALAIAICDLISIVALYSVINAWTAGGEMTFKQMQTLTIQILTDVPEFDDFAKEFQDKTMIDNAFRISVLLYTFAIIRTVIRHKDFTRQIGDYRAIVHKFAMIGNFEEVIKWSNRAGEVLGWSNKSNPADPNLLAAKAAAFLALGQIGDARSTARRVLVLLDKPDREEAIYLSLCSLCIFYPIPAMQIANLLKSAIQGGMTDFNVRTGVASALQYGELRPSDVRPVFDVQHERSGNQKFPLSRATVEIFDGDLRTAESVLQSASTNNTQEELVRQIMLHGVRLLNVKDAQMRSETSRSLVNQVSTMKEELKAIEDTQKWPVIGCLSETAAMMKYFGLKEAVDLERLRAEIIDSIDDQAERSFGGGMSQQVGERALRTLRGS
jgi:hypothetical protein